MKKLIALLLALLMLVPMMTMGISAAESTSSAIDSAMFVHYDFSLDSYHSGSALPIFKNLARTNGQNASQGRLISSNSQIWDQENGTLECGVAGTSGSPYMENNLMATIIPTAENLTIFTRFKLDSDVAEATTADKTYRLVQKKGNDTLRIDFIDKAEGTDDRFIVWFNAKGYEFTGITYDDISNGFVNVAVVAYDDGNGNFLVKMYAVAEGKYMQLKSSRADDYSFGTSLEFLDNPTEKMYLIGLQTLGVVMDDFRMYTAALSAGDLYSISANTFGASAEDSLFVHYDLSADSLTGSVYKNLVNGGTVGSTGALGAGDENLVLNTDEGTVKNGGATTPTWINNAYLGSFIESADEFTIFTRFKLDASLEAATGSKKDYTVFKKGGQNNFIFQDKADTDADVFWWQITLDGTPTNFIFEGISFDDLQRGYVNVAVVFYKGYNGDTSDNLYMKMYASKGDETQMTELKANRASTSVGTTLPLPAATNNMNLMTATGMIMDEFRMYATDLTAADLQTVVNGANFADDLSIVGVQESVNASDFSVRFVGGIDTLKYDEVGIEIIPTLGGNTADSALVETSRKVFSSILENGTPVTAEEKGCEYFLAFVVNGIPLDADSDEQITFEFRFFATSGETTYYSRSSTATYGFDGVLVA